jgi:putative ABC transport system permease protein
VTAVLRFVLAGLRFRKARLLLSSAAIALGVAFVSGTLLLNASVSSSYYSGFAVGAKNVGVLVASHRSGNPPGQPAGQSVPKSLLRTIRAVPGAGAVDGRVIGPAGIVSPSTGKVIGNGFGVNVTAADPSLSGFTVVTGHLPAASDQVDIDKSTAADEHFRLGQAVRVVTSTGAIRTFSLVGTISLGVDPVIGNAAVLAFQTRQAFSVTGQSGYSMIVARGLPGVSQGTLASRVTAAAPGYEVRTGAQFAAAEADSATHVGDTFTIGLLIFAGISLIVACIVVYNTFGILVAQRSREFALLRCVGAGRRQVFGGMLGEALAAGAAASAVGAAAGTGLSWALGRLVRPSGASPAPLTIEPAAIAIAVATGVLVTVGASVLPAVAATRVAPVAAVGGAPATAPVTRKAGWARIAFAFLAAVVGLGLTMVGMRTPIPGGLIAVAAGGCVFFLAVLALGPLLAPPLLALFAWLPASLTGYLAGRPGAVTVRMAAAGARRNPHRVAATTAALTIGLTLMTLFTVVISSAGVSADAAVAGHFPFDYIVDADGGQPVPPRIVAALDRAPGLGVVAEMFSQRAAVDGHQLIVGAYSHDALGTVVKPAMVAGSLAAVGPGAAAVGSGPVGGAITVSTPDAGRMRLRIVAVYDAKTYRTPIPDVLISTADFIRGYHPAGADEVVIDASPGVSPAASRAAVTAAVAGDPLLAVHTLADYKATLNSQIDSILELVGALLGLAILIALIGISNTLTLSVIERTRESAVLRALGLTRGQLRRMLLTEALLMAALAALLGAGLGIGFGAAIVYTFRNSGSGIGVLSLPFGNLVLYAAIAAAAAAAAAVLPSRRAARISVVAALSDLLCGTRDAPTVRARPPKIRRSSAALMNGVRHNLGQNHYRPCRHDLLSPRGRRYAKVLRCDVSRRRECCEH